MTFTLIWITFLADFCVCSSICPKKVLNVRVFPCLPLTSFPLSTSPKAGQTAFTSLERKRTLEREVFHFGSTTKAFSSDQLTTMEDLEIFPSSTNGRQSWLIKYRRMMENTSSVCPLLATKCSVWKIRSQRSWSTSKYLHPTPDYLLSQA